MSVWIIVEIFNTITGCVLVHILNRFLGEKWESFNLGLKCAVYVENYNSSAMKLFKFILFCMLFTSSAAANDGLMGIGSIQISSAMANDGLIGIGSIQIQGSPVSLASSVGLVGMGAAGISHGPERGELSGDRMDLKLDDDVGMVGRKIGPGRVLPDIKMKLQYNDNLTLESANQINTFATVISPHVAYVVSDKTRKFVLDYILEAAFHEASSNDDYADNRVRASFDYQPTSRISTSVFSEFRNSHDGRGTGRAEAGRGITQASLDEWHAWGLGGIFAYGATSAKGRLEFESVYQNKVYDTNRQFTFSRDRSELMGVGRFFYRLRPKTSLVFEGRLTDYDYHRDAPGTPSLDGIYATLLTGVTWEATYKTTGFAKIGVNTREFESSQRESAGGFTWQVGFDWLPRSYSKVHFETAQVIDETEGTGDAIDTSYVLMNWEHFWKDRFSTLAQITYSDSTIDNTNREDTSYEAIVSANYAFRHWLTLGAGYRRQSLDSTDGRFDYDQNLVEITLDVIF